MIGYPQGFRQTGAVTLLTCVVMVLLASLVFMHHSQTILGNIQAERAVARLEIARNMSVSGLEWALALINSPLKRSSNCTPGSGHSPTFRQMLPNRTGFQAHCHFAGDRPVCSCPNGPDENLPDLPPSETAVDGFAIQVLQKTSSWVITSRGCATSWVACSHDAEGQHRNVQNWEIKPLALLLATPTASLTCAGECRAGVQTRIANNDENGSGYLVRSGKPLQSMNHAEWLLWPGTPLTAALKEADTALSSQSGSDPLCTQSARIRAITGLDMTTLSQLPQVKTLKCRDACADQIRLEIQNGWRVFNLSEASELILDASTTWGSATDPLILFAPRQLTLLSNTQWFGWIMFNRPDATLKGSTGANIRGAVDACGALSVESIAIEFDEPLLGRLREGTTRFAVIPGSWTDW